MIKHIAITVYGKVQGVFFRASTKEKADELGVKGFVSNKPDGSVYIEAEGNAEELIIFTEWCKKGPRMAKVDQCTIENGEVVNFKDFQITR
jgi:acylphosphatase